MTTDQPKRPPGRPRSRPGRQRLEAYFSDAEIEAIAAAAARAGIPVSHWLRQVATTCVSVHASTTPTKEMR